ncbi:MAG: efflux RND transporter periplasmic adaptor subunit [Alphaproteobacteria bacterium]|nr:efflux RND transporter periplasmic adaptor subunit [Alphaproteobacteria bacterium]
MDKNIEKKSSSFHMAAYTLLILLVIGLGYRLYLSQKEKSALPGADAAAAPVAVVIDVLPIAPKDVMLSKHYIGYVTPVHSVSVLPFISGFVENVCVQNGQHVQAGQLLAVLEQGEYKASLNLSRAAVMQATANYENAASYYQRIQAAGEKAVAQADRDKAQAEFLSAKAALAQAQAQLSAAEVNYNYTLIRAPISGLIGTVQPTKGDYVSPAGTPLMTILQVSPIQVVFSITDKDYIQNVIANGLNDLLADNTIRLQLANGEFYPVQGVYQYAENALDRSTNSVAVYVSFDNPDNILIPNAYVTVYLEQEFKNVVALPQNKISLTPEGSFATIADRQGIRQQKIEIIDSQGADYIVKNTFAPQTYLVAGKPPALKENEPFRLNILSDQAE